MLIKLVRYDLKYGVRMFCVIHLLLFIAVALCRFLLLDRMDFFHMPTQTLGTYLGFLLLFFLLLFSLVPFGTTLLIAARFYKNLFTDEGYLTWTLPVSGAQQLWGKIISGLIWSLLDAGIIYLILRFAVSGRNVQSLYAELAAECTAALGMSIPDFAHLMLLLSAFGSLYSVLMLYCSLTLGQMFPAHRLLCSVVVYFILYSVLTFINYVIMFLLHAIHGIGFDLLAENTTVADILHPMMPISLLLSALICILLYTVTHLILTGKPNLI